MRSERLLRIVVLLQSRGRLTAGELASELEVAVRTIQRDMEALSGAGIPVFGSRGAGGGWELLPGYRSSLTGLSTKEALAIVIGRPRSILADLGLDDAGDDAVTKLLASVPPDARARAEHARQRLYVDPVPWGTSPQPESPLLPRLQEAVWDDRIVRMRYAASKDTFEVSPLGLVTKGNQWYLVAASDRGVRTYRVVRIHDVVVTGRRFERPDDFDLVSHWQRSTTDYVAGLPSYVVRLRLRGRAIARVGWVYGRDKRVSEPDADGWVDAEMDCEDLENALATVRSLGEDVRVEQPAELREHAVRYAQTFVTANE